MKRNMIALLGAALLVVVGCKKNDETTPNPVGEKMTFTATMGGGEKTFIDGVTMSWKDGDEITINGKTFTAGDVTENSATFTGPMVDPPYHAYYLAEGSGTTGVLSATQHYHDPDESGKANLSGVNPMYAESGTTSLTFHNICALVRLTLNGKDSDKVQSIVVTADQPLCGAFTVVNNYADITSGEGNTVTLDCGEDGVALNGDGVDFYVALPQGDYESIEFKVTRVDGSFWTYTAKKSGTSATTSLTAGKLYFTETLEPQFIYKESNGYKGVQLWDGGPCWATCNVGAQNPWEYGDYYQWAEGTRGGQPGWNLPYTIYSAKPDDNSDTGWEWIKSGGFLGTNAPYNNGNDSYSKYTSSSGPAKLDDCDDIAHLRWDGGWHIPDEEDFVALCTNCYLEWGTHNGTEAGVAGLRVYVADEDHKGLFRNGTTYKKWNGGSYINYSEPVSPVQDAPVLFLPAAGYCSGPSRIDATSYGYYWSRSLYSTSSSRAYYLHFRSGNVGPASYNTRYHGRSVRPVW